MKILGIPGSLRKASFNRMALEAAKALLPTGATLETFGLDGIPVFSQDLEGSPPPRVVELKQAIRAADAVLFCTPEYNYSIPGGLKNAIDWASRPYGDNAWQGKPAALMGASVGNLGTARAQYHLRQSLVFFDMPLLQQPEAYVGDAFSLFDEAGEFNSESTQAFFESFIGAFAAWIERTSVKALAA